MSDQFDFSHLTGAVAVQADKTRPYQFHQIKGEPVLHCLPATDENKAFRNDQLARINKRRKSLKRNTEITTALMVKARAEDRDLFVKHCIKGWSGILDRAGAEVPFSTGAATAFLSQVPDYIFDDFRIWLTDPESFIDGDAGDSDDEDEDDPDTETEASTLGE